MTATLQANRAAFLAEFNVSRETLIRLDALVGLLVTWQARMNLIAPASLDEVWTRHIGDSLQLAHLGPPGAEWVDLGSGGGFPGLVLAIEDPLRRVHMVESNGRKCGFLRAALAATGSFGAVHHARIGDALPGVAPHASVVSARALAPLGSVLNLAWPLLKTGALGVFPKGREVETELTEARRSWILEVTLIPSRIAKDSTVVLVHSATPRSPS